MSRPVIEILPDRVIKRYPAKLQDRWFKELAVYHILPWACPRLLAFDYCVLEIERWTPIMEMPDGKKYAGLLKDLLERLHEQGWWHCDASLVNVVVKDGLVRLIDWENVRPRCSDVSYDLHGAVAAGIRPAHVKQLPDGIWWGSGKPNSPARVWGL